jgi:hypothetical protein
MSGRREVPTIAAINSASMSALSMDNALKDSVNVLKTIMGKTALFL